MRLILLIIALALALAAALYFLADTTHKSRPRRRP